MRMGNFFGETIEDIFTNKLPPTAHKRSLLVFSSFSSIFTNKFYLSGDNSVRWLRNVACARDVSSYIMGRIIIIFVVLLISIQFSCEKKIDDLQFEKNVMNEVFTEIVDSIYRDRRTMLPPPFPRLDFKTNREDTIGFHNRLTEYNRFQDSIKNDTTRILLAVYDSVKTYKNHSFKKSETNYVNDYKLDLTRFKNNKKFNFKSSSLFPDQLIWDIDDFKSSLPVGVIYVCRIQFNDKKDIGTLEAASSCGGGKCGQGYLITIEKKSGRWKVSKVKETWMS